MIEPMKDDDTLGEQYSVLYSGSRGRPTRKPAAAYLANHAYSAPVQQLEVLLFDQLFRWTQGCAKPVARIPGRASQANRRPGSPTRLKLIQGEFLARLERGEDPDPAAYIEKFPDLAEEIQTQCEVTGG